MSDLITTSSIVPSEVFVEKGLDPTLKIIRKKIDEFKPDMTTAKGRKEIASMAHRVAQSKTLLDGMGKDLTAEIKATAKGVDAERKRVRDILDGWKVEVRQPLTDWEEAEAQRETELTRRLDDMNERGNMPTGATVEQIDEQIAVAEAWTIDDTWGDREGLAQTTKEKVLEKLQERRADRLQFEEQQAELEAQRIENEKIQAENMALKRKEAEAHLEKMAAEEEAREAERVKREAARAEEDRIESERQRKEREEQMKQEAADRATAEAEAKAMEERERLEREKQEALDREARAKEEAKQAAENERNRIAAEKLAEEEAARKREENKRHRGKINTAAKKAFVAAGLSDDDAVVAVKAIAAGTIPNVKISY